MIKLTTTLGEITLELDAAKAPLTVANFLEVREERALRQHDLPPRHRRLHDPGWRL
jgi:cyclophilin family peptidyl-prolyl cis-trans isomerase